MCLYFRLRGCYSNLDGGKLSDALVDMTGGMSETISLNPRSEIPHNIHDLLWKSSQMNSLIGGSIHVCSINTFIYSLYDVFQVLVTMEFYFIHLKLISHQDSFPYFDSNYIWCIPVLNLGHVSFCLEIRMVPVLSHVKNGFVTELLRVLFYNSVVLHILYSFSFFSLELGMPFWFCFSFN